MGCATSKQKDHLCRNCQGSCSPPPIPRRSYSLHRRHTPPYSGDPYHHLVSLTSSSLEPLKIESFHKTEQRVAPFDDEVAFGIRDEKRVCLIEAKMWSKMIDKRIPKIVPRTPIRTPPGEPEIINAWELMEGLEDISPLRPVNHLRSFSFHFGPNFICNRKNEIGEREELFAKPMWLELADNETGSKSLEFDQDFISTFREALYSANEEVLEKEENVGNFEIKGENEENLETGKDSEFYGKREKSRVEIAFKENNFEKEKKIKNRAAVLYFTSLRGVRKTYEECCHVRVILKSIGVKIDERDVWMHSGFKEELKELLGDKFSTSPLPRVFFGEIYIGGAEEIKQMHEEGRLEGMLLDGGDVAEDEGVCKACGDVRFVPCDRCSGSCKIYYGDENECDYNDEYESEKFDDNECGFQRCPDCNENGLVRCPTCCD